ncbi:MAG: aspartate dehydrogenase [Lachnospiraceae bacterium]|nr:aspartate dehydrogenase [Lachnospiraceae bacterium]
MFGRKKKTSQTLRSDSETRAYDPALYKPVLKCSICNGERVAGFKNRQTGKFEEVACIKNDRELDDFLRRYGLDHIDKEY